MIGFLVVDFADASSKGASRLLAAVHFSALVVYVQSNVKCWFLCVSQINLTSELSVISCRSSWHLTMQSICYES